MVESSHQEIQREVVSLRDYLEQKINGAVDQLSGRVSGAVDRLTDRITAETKLSEKVRELATQAIDKYEAAQRQRDVVSNEFRASLEDQAKNQVSSELFNSSVKELGQRIDKESDQGQKSLATAIATLGEKIEADRERLGALEKNNAAVNAGVQQKSKGTDTSLQWINVVVGVGGLAALVIGLYIATRPAAPIVLERAPVTQDTTP